MNMVSSRQRPHQSEEIFTLSVLLFFALASSVVAQDKIGDYTIAPGHPSLQEWLLENASATQSMVNDELSTKRIELGRTLFFEPMLSHNKETSCATCHIPEKGWTRGGEIDTNPLCPDKPIRATPSIVNAGFCSVLQWDGKATTLEEQVLMVVESHCVMNLSIDKALAWLGGNKAYKHAFEDAYPKEKLTKNTFASAIASFERSLIANDTAFDRWVRGDSKAMTAAQVRGFAVFLDEDKGNCIACHHPPHFSDDGFHNIGLASFGHENPDLGRYNLKPIKVLKGAFKTPTLRNVAYTAPYFHDNSAATLMEVIDLYVDGGYVKTNLSPDMKELSLSRREKDDLLEFLHALSQTSINTPNAPAVNLNSAQND